VSLKPNLAHGVKWEVPNSYLRAVSWWVESVAVLAFLYGCAEMRPATDLPGLRVTSEGDSPVVCYVRAKSFNGLVPMSCREAAMVRP